MSWHARRLVDLVDSLARRINKGRYDTLARHLGRSPGVDAGGQRGFVIVQIDGLAYDYLIEAIARGYVPRLRRLLSRGRYRLARWRCGLPSTTPAVQAGMMFGDRFDIPGFRWYEKDKGWSVACKLPRAARALQERVAAARPGILRGGSSYMSLLDGEASLSLLNLGSLGDGHFLENVKGAGFLVLFLLSPWRVVRAAVLSLWEYGRDLFKRLVALLIPGYYESPRLISPLLKVLANVIIQELQTFSAYLDIHRGTPAIYTNYYGYDETAHHFGPNNHETFRALRGIDRQIGRLERQALAAQRRGYDFYVMSDHGQTPSTAFRKQYGQTLGQLIVDNIESAVSIDERSSGEQTSEAQTMILLAELSDIEARLRPAGARLLRAARRFVDERAPLYDEADWDLTRRNDVVVRNSGSLAHVYFNVSREALDLSDIAVLYPRLLPSLLAHPGIGWTVGRQGGQVVVMNQSGTLTLGRWEHLEGRHPLADLPEPGYAAGQLRQLARYPHSGDLILLGAWRGGRVVAFEDQAASHGGMGGAQDYPFLIYPAQVTPSLDGRDGPVALYEHFIGYQPEFGVRVSDLEASERVFCPSAGKQVDLTHLRLMNLGRANPDRKNMLRSDKTHKAVEVLAAIPSFAGLDVTLLEAIARAANRRSYNAGQVVFIEGEPCAGLYVVQEGWLKSIKISKTGREQIIYFIGPGETFNEVGVVASGLNPATAEALEPAKVWILQRDALLRLMDEHPPLARIITQNLAKRVLQLMKLVENLSLQTVEARLAGIFLEHSTSDVLNRRRWSTQAEMAARLGTVPDVLNRALRSLAEEGLIQIERHQIQILDRKGLERKALLGG